jgi:hypothetical protein
MYVSLKLISDAITALLVVKSYHFELQLSTVSLFQKIKTICQKSSYYVLPYSIVFCSHTSLCYLISLLCRTYCIIIHTVFFKPLTSNFKIHAAIMFLTVPLQAVIALSLTAIRT